MKRKSQSAKWFLLPVVSVLLVSLLFLVGCKPGGESDKTPTPEPPKQEKPILVPRTELQPDTSNEFQRIYRSTPDGTLVSLQTDYRDGTTKIEFYRKDGSVKEEKEYHAHVVDKLKSHTTFDTDGNPIKKEGYRVNGNLESVTEYLPDDNERVTLYRIDGKRLHSITLDAMDGTKETTYYRQDGKTVWAKAVWKGPRSVVVDYYDEATGKLSHSLAKEQSGKSITVYDDSGKALYVQHYSGYWSTYSYYSYSSYQLTDVEEFEDDGVTVKRRISVERYSNNRVSKLEYFKDGELVQEQDLHWDGSVKTDKTLKDDGTWDSNSHDQGELETEAIDTKVFDEPVDDNPLDDNPNHFL